MLRFAELYTLTKHITIHDTIRLHYAITRLDLLRLLVNAHYKERADPLYGELIGQFGDKPIRGQSNRGLVNSPTENFFQITKN